MALDRIDIAILEALQRDGRIPNSALADKVGLSQSACSRRLDNLEKSGVIRGYHARLSNAALGHQMTAIVHISLSGQFEKTLSDFEAAVNDLDGVYLYDIDSLQQLADASLAVRQSEVEICEQLIARHVAEFTAWLSAPPHPAALRAQPEGAKT